MDKKNNPEMFSGIIDEKSFIQDIKGCKKVNVKNYFKNISCEIENETGIEKEITYIEGYFQVEIIRSKRITDSKDNILELILKEIREVKEDVAVLKEDVTILKQDVTLLKEDVAILKEDVTILKQDVTLLKEDVAILKQDVADIKRCPTVAKELEISNSNK